MDIGLGIGRQVLDQGASWVASLYLLLKCSIRQLRDVATWTISQPFRRASRYITKARQFAFGFRYDDSVEDEHIRLLRLNKSFSSSVPALTIHTFPLSDCPPYLSLSYTWGPPIRARPPYTSFDLTSIRLNNKPFLVLPNLFDAITQLCASRPGAYLWVDSICINQDNLDERAAQVFIMDRIYTGASETIIWLGPSTERTERAVGVVQRIANGAEGRILHWTTTQTFGDVFVADDAYLLEKNGLPLLTADDWTDVSDIFTRSWFGRVWMIQEVALSKNPTVHIGNCQLPWDTIGCASFMVGLSNALVGLYAIGSGARNMPLVLGLIHAGGLHLIREWSLGEPSKLYHVFKSTNFTAGITTKSDYTTLLRLLLGTTGLKATFRRDRIYALLGIAKHLSRMQQLPTPCLHVDYLSSDDEILTALGHDLFQHTKSLHLLSHAGLASRSAPSNMATWIPSFENYNAPILGPDYTSLPPFNASNTAPSQPSTFVIDTELSILHVQAISPHLGTIESLAEPWPDLLSGRFLNCINILLHAGETYPYTSQPIVEAFWRTLIMDEDMAQRPAPAQLAPSFAAWMTLISLTGMNSNYSSNPFLQDLFDSLEPLWVLANSRDITNLLPKSSDMYPRLCSFGLLNDAGIPRISDDERQKIILDLGNKAAPYEGMLRFKYLPGRRFARTVRGYLCLVPLSTEVGDKIMIVNGCPTPLVLRRAKDVENRFKVVGDSYVHGAMFGEHIVGDSIWRDISLV